MFFNILTCPFPFFNLTLQFVYFVFSQLPVVVCDRPSLFVCLTFLSNCSFALPVIFLNAAAAVAAILLKRFFISYLLALSSVKVSTLP